MAPPHHETQQASIDGFVAMLAQVRERAGNPSFREMAKRSGAISHATLHDAVQGTRMPSWETTVEFARACEVDPAQLRPAWERADAVVHPQAHPQAEPSRPEPVSAPAGAAPAQDTSPGISVTAEPVTGASGSRPEQDPPSEAAEPRLDRGALLLSGLVGAAVALAGVLTYQAVDSSDPAGSAARGFAAVPSTGTGPCPSNALSWPRQSPSIPGDSGALVADVTLPDCSVQPRAAALTKIWKIRNEGNVPWTGRWLRRIEPSMGPQHCRAQEKVPVPDARPGQTVEISVQVDTPDRPATCYMRWMYTFSNGDYAFPGQRPLFFSFFVR